MQPQASMALPQPHAVSHEQQTANSKQWAAAGEVEGGSTARAGVCAGMQVWEMQVEPSDFIKIGHRAAKPQCAAPSPDRLGGGVRWVGVR